MIREFTIDEVPVVDQLKGLVLLHWEEVQKDGDEEFNIDNQMYHNAAKIGMLRMVGAFDGDKLIGYYAALFVPSWNTVGVKIAQDLGWYVHPEHRGGLTAVKLVKAIEDLARQNGCTTNAISIKMLKYPKAEKLLLRLNYICTEHRLCKSLKDNEHA